MKPYLWRVHENALSELPSAELHLQSRAARDGGSAGLVTAKHCEGLKNTHTQTFHNVPPPLSVGPTSEEKDQMEVLSPFPNREISKRW